MFLETEPAKIDLLAVISAGWRLEIDWVSFVLLQSKKTGYFKGCGCSRTYRDVTEVKVCQG